MNNPVFSERPRGPIYSNREIYNRTLQAAEKVKAIIPDYSGDKFAQDANYRQQIANQATYIYLDTHFVHVKKKEEFLVGIQNKMKLIESWGGMAQLQDSEIISAFAEIAALVRSAEPEENVNTESANSLYQKILSGQRVRMLEAAAYTTSAQFLCYFNPECGTITFNDLHPFSIAFTQTIIKLWGAENYAFASCSDFLNNDFESSGFNIITTHYFFRILSVYEIYKFFKQAVRLLDYKTERTGLVLADSFDDFAYGINPDQLKWIGCISRHFNFALISRAQTKEECPTKYFVFLKRGQ